MPHDIVTSIVQKLRRNDGQLSFSPEDLAVLNAELHCVTQSQPLFAALGELTLFVGFLLALHEQQSRRAAQQLVECLEMHLGRLLTSAKADVQERERARHLTERLAATKRALEHNFGSDAMPKPQTKGAGVRLPSSRRSDLSVSLAPFGTVRG